MLMQITLTKEQIKEVFGELRYMGADYCYRYDKDTRKKTEDIEAVKLHLGSMKLGNSGRRWSGEQFPGFGSIDALPDSPGTGSL